MEFGKNGKGAKSLASAGVAIALCAGMCAMLAGCSSGSSTPSGPAKPDATLEERMVAGIEMEVPSDFDEFEYMEDGTLYYAMEDDSNGAIMVTELMELEGQMPEAIDEEFMERTLLMAFTDIKWVNYETGIEFGDSITYNSGTCTMKNSSGVTLNTVVHFYMYDDFAAQAVIAFYAEGSESSLAYYMGDVMASINPDTAVMAEYLIKWSMNSALGLDTAQISEGLDGSTIAGAASAASSGSKKAGAKS